MPAPDLPAEFDVFVSAPMAAFRSADKYRAFRADVLAVVGGLEECGLSAFFAGRDVESPDAFDEPDESAVRDRARYFLLIYPERVVSSVLVEAVRRALHKEPAARHPSAQAMLDELTSG